MAQHFVALATGQAVAVYLLPIVVVLWRLRAQGPLSWAIAIPAVVAADLLLVLLLALFVPLEQAVIAARGAWLAGTLALFLATRRRVASPRHVGLQRRDLWIAAAAATGALAQSLALSRTYNIWDRDWHVPLVASLRGQMLPFENVFEPGRVLHYHFSGDVLAVMLQVLSGATIHASRALSVAHDLMFALTGACIALFLLGMGKRRALPVVICAWAITLSGPFALLSQNALAPFDGYAFLNFVSMSFRPHVSLFGLLAVGFAALIGASSRGAVGTVGLAVVLAALVALGGITDEISAALLVVAMGAVWLFEPEFLHRRRLTGFLIIGGLVAAYFVPNLLFQASLSPGGPARATWLVLPRWAGYGMPELPLGSIPGMLAFLLDSVPTLSAAAALFLFPVSGQADKTRAVRVLLGALLAVSLFGIACIELNATPLESHRFMTAALLVTPLFALAFAEMTGKAVGLLVTSLALSATSTLAWIVAGAPFEARYFRDVSAYSLDCRAATGAELGQRPAPTYLSRAIWEAYAGCRPVYTAGTPRLGTWDMKVGGPLLGPRAAPLVREMLTPGDPLTMVCVAAGETDPLCRAARSNCAPAGTTAVICAENSGLMP